MKHAMANSIVVGSLVGMNGMRKKTNTAGTKVSRISQPIILFLFLAIAASALFTDTLTLRFIKAIW